MKLDQSNPTHRVLMAVLITGVVTFAVWGVWMSLGAVFGATGWVFARLGGIFLRAMNGITAVHGIVAWIGFGCGAVFGIIVGFNVRADRLWARLSRREPRSGNAAGHSGA